MPMAGGGYAGLYRLFEDSDWKYVCEPRSKAVKPFPSASEAIRAAKDTIRRKLNPELKATTVEVEEDDPDILQIEKWRIDKQELYAKARAMVRNGKNRRQVVVEHKTKKAVKK